MINLISGISSLLAIGILTPMQSIIWLIILFISIAISLYNNDFILLSILYILIYIGAIAILFLFILSLLKIDYRPKYNNNPLIITLLILSFIPLDLCYNNNNNNNTSDLNKINKEDKYNMAGYAGEINGYAVETKEWINENINITNNEILIVGLQFYTEYAFFLILISILIIISIVGAITLTKKC